MAKTTKKTTTPKTKKTTTAATGESVRKTTTGTPPSIITHEQIRARAYEIYMARGGRPGSPEQDWAQAETELRNGIRR
jgi:hypothetical protein